MITRQRRMLAAAAALVLCLTGCSAGEEVFPGSWGSDEKGEPSLTIDDDSSFEGTDGCNHLSGQGTISGDTFRFGNFVTTLKACEGVDQWLAKADTAQVIDGDLVVYGQDGEKIGTLAGE